MKLLNICGLVLIPFLILGIFLSSTVVDAKATTSPQQITTGGIEEEQQVAYNKKINSNLIENWPQGPQIYAESAIVMEASTGAILYNKDMDMLNYPASITKIMTALITLEHYSLDEIVTYSYYATHSIEPGSSSIGITEGEELTVEESLYALLLESANECGNGLAEHIAGSVDAFAIMMNKKAMELGCTNTHFVNPHGLPDENHYTSAHDMALITQAALQYEDFIRISGTKSYQIPPTNKDDEITYMKNHHKMIASYNGDERFLDNTVISGKTGYTSIAKHTLVTVAKRCGMTFIVVTMHTIPTAETGIPVYTDTALLLDYASENFKKIDVATNETRFLLPKSGYFILDETVPSFRINTDSNIILPKEVDFGEASLELVFTDNNSNPDTIAILYYTYKGHPVGFAELEHEEIKKEDSDFVSRDGLKNNSSKSLSEKIVPEKRFIVINIRIIYFIVIAIIIIFLLYKLVRYLIYKYEFLIKHSYRRRMRKRFVIRRKKSKYSTRNYRRISKKNFDDIDL